MIYLTAIFVPPLYFLIKKRWAGFIVSTGLFFLAMLFAIMFLFPLTFILWFLCSIAAVWNLRNAKMHEHANLLATKMAEKMREAQTVPPVPKN